LFNAAKAILTEHRDQLEALANLLMETETVDHTQFFKILGRELPPEASSPAQG